MKIRKVNASHGIIVNYIKILSIQRIHTKKWDRTEQTTDDNEYYRLNLLVHDLKCIEK